MDERMLDCYNTELRHLREMAGEFAREFPKIAGRLYLDRDAKEICPDPYVERLLEGFAYLAARVHLKLDAEFPRFTQSLLETVYPHYLSPVPSMCVVRISPELADPALAEGVTIPRGTLLRSLLGKGERTASTFSTAHEVTLLPLEIEQARYCIRELPGLNIPAHYSSKAAIHLRLKRTVPLPWNEVRAEPLTVFIRGADEFTALVYEQLFAAGRGVLLQDPANKGKTLGELPPSAIQQVGFKDSEALLPPSPRTFEGYRLLREYFAFPQRFLFFKLAGVDPLITSCKGSSLDLIIPLSRPELRLENRVDASSFELHCTPAVNLFPKRLDRVDLSNRFSEFQVIADHNRPLDYEVFQIEEVLGYGGEAGEVQRFRPFYQAKEADRTGGAFYTTHRVNRVLSAREKRHGPSSDYAGTEVYLSLVDVDAVPYRSELRQLGIKALCTNRHLPIGLALGTGRTDFTLEINAPISSVRCLSGPTYPAHSLAEGAFSWRLISHLSLNYLSLLDEPGEGGARALKEILGLYAPPQDVQSSRQIEGVESIQSRPILRRVNTPGPITFARGLEITLTLNETAFEGTGVFILGAVMDQFFAKYVSLNSFTETVIRTQQRGEIMRWPARLGKRRIL